MPIDGIIWHKNMGLHMETTYDIVNLVEMTKGIRRIPNGMRLFWWINET